MMMMIKKKKKKKKKKKGFTRLLSAVLKARAPF